MQISKRDIRFINSAMRAAASGKTRKRYKLGAVIVKSGRVLAWGYNANKNRPEDWIPREAWSVHAEESCLKKLPTRDSVGGTLYVARISKQGQPRLSKPCDNCQALASSYGVERIVYTTDSGVSILVPK
jgi:deoxycytidylate deaminase